MGSVIKIEFLSVRNPRWSRDDRRAIDCLVKTNTLVGEHAFTASLDDCEPHGRELYTRLLSGEFGEIAPMERQSIPKTPVNFEIPPKYRLLEKFFIEVNQENGRQSFRSVVIVWASILDNLLDVMLEGDVSRAGASGQLACAPPHSFDARIRLAKQRGLIDDADAEKYQHIRRIRNMAAHEWQLSLQSKGVLPSLRGLCQADHSQLLVFHEDLEFLLQQVYSGSCAILAIKLARSSMMIDGSEPVSSEFATF